MTRSPRRHESAEHIELQGPDNPTITRPPERRVGVMVVGSIVGVALVGLLGLTVAKPELFVNVVQAFVGNF